MYERNYRERVLKQEAVAQQHRQFPWKRLVGFGIGALIIVGFVFLVRAPFQQVRMVHVNGTEVADPDEVSLYVQASLEGNRLYLFPRSSTILLSTHSIEKRLKAAFPRFKNISVNRDGFHSLSVTVQEYKGIYLWCKESCFFMDENGIVFAPAPYFSGSAYIRVTIGEVSTLPFRPISDEELSTTKLLIERLRAIMIEPNEFRFSSPYELTVSFSHNGYSSELLIDPSRDIETSLEALYAGMRAESFARLYRDESKRLEYINLRFNNKMVYKFQ